MRRLLSIGSAGLIEGGGYASLTYNRSYNENQYNLFLLH